MIPVTDVYVEDIALPGAKVKPLWAVHAKADRLYVFTDYRALSSDRAVVERVAEKVRQRGVINPDLWDHATRTYDETANHMTDMWLWEEEEKMAGRW